MSSSPFRARHCLRFEYAEPGRFSSEPGAYCAGALRIEEDNWHTPTLCGHFHGYQVLVWGHPIIGGRIDLARVAERLGAAGNLADAARSVNGTFVALRCRADGNELQIMNDRFGALPLYWHCHDGHLRASTSFKALYDELPGSTRSLDPAAVFEFVYFRRLFGARTYHRDCRFLESASVLTITRERRSPKLQTYWQPTFEKHRVPREQFADELAEAISNATGAYSTACERPGLLLSGGLDSRALLAAHSPPPTCFTNCPKPNNEFAVAAELAEIAGAEHVFIPRPRSFLDAGVDDSVYLSGGMTVYNEAQFAGYGPTIRPHSDMVMLGLALDVFFCGHYLPKHLVTLMGRPGLHFALDPIPNLPVDAFLARASYRLKTSDPFSVVSLSRQGQLREHLHAVVRDTMTAASSLGADPYDQWEHMHLHNLARHYSFQMAASVRSYVDCRIPALENTLLELSLRMPAEYKFNWDIYQRAIERLNPSMARIRNANTNLPANMPLRRQSALHWSRNIANRVFRTRIRSTPEWWDRSWPRPRESIDANPNIQTMVAGLGASARLAGLGVFDMDQISALARAHRAGEHDHTVLLNVLLTIDRFLA